MYSLNDIVIIKEEYLNSKEESRLLFKIVNINDETKRLQIVCINSGLTFSPIELVGFEMVEKL